MPLITCQQKAQLVRLYYLNGENAHAAIRRETGVRNVCSSKTVKRISAKFLATGSVKDATRSGRPKLDDDTAAELAIATTDISQGNIHGECSTRAVAAATGISPTKNGNENGKKGKMNVITW